MRLKRADLTAEDKILSRRVALDLQKEIFRKSIHVCAVFVTFLLRWRFWLTLSLLLAVLALYVFAEIARLKGKTVPIFTAITEAAARKRDENRFVFGPVTLCAGIILTALFFEPREFSVGICSLGLGDGIASVVGKTFGRTRILGGKSAEGSLACFLAIFLVAVFWSCGAGAALVLALAGMLVELLPLRDFDNLLIPLVIAALARALA